MNYWELTKKERAVLTSADVEGCIDFHLMIEGIPRSATPTTVVPAAPTFEPLDEWWEVAGCSVLFRTQEQALTFIGLQPHTEAYEWAISSKHKFAKPYGGGYSEDMVPRSKKLYRQEDIAAHAQELKKYNTIKEKYDREWSKYNKVAEAEKKAIAVLWDDWHDCKREADGNDAIMVQYDKYLTMTNGDSTVAHRFLVKAFGEDAVHDAFAWCERVEPQEVEPSNAQ